MSHPECDLLQAKTAALKRLSAIESNTERNEHPTTGIMNLVVTLTSADEINKQFKHLDALTFILKVCKEHCCQNDVVDKHQSLGPCDFDDDVNCRHCRNGPLQRFSSLDEDCHVWSDSEHFHDVFPPHHWTDHDKAGFINFVMEIFGFHLKSRRKLTIKGATCGLLHAAETTEAEHKEVPPPESETLNKNDPSITEETAVTDNAPTGALTDVDDTKTCALDSDLSSKSVIDTEQQGPALRDSDNQEFQAPQEILDNPPMTCESKSNIKLFSTANNNVVHHTVTPDNDNMPGSDNAINNEMNNHSANHNQKRATSLF